MMHIAIAAVTASGCEYYTELALPAGSSVFEAIEASGWLDLAEFAEFRSWCDAHRDADPDHKAWYVGIFSQKKRLDTVLAEGDRVEIYRPLIIDPMTKRKKLSKNLSKKRAKQAAY